MTLKIKKPIKREGFEKKPYVDMHSETTGETVRYVFNSFSHLNSIKDSLEMVDGGVRMQLFSRENGEYQKYVDVFFPDSIVAPNPEARIYEVKPQWSMGIYTREDAWRESEEYRCSISADPC